MPIKKLQERRSVGDIKTAQQWQVCDQILAGVLPD
jgi:hypothetical protein